MIGWQDHHRRLGIACGDPSNAERNGGCGVAFLRFGKDVFRWQIGQHGAHACELLGIGEDDNVLPRHHTFETVDGQFEQGFVSEELEQLFGLGISADRPKTLAAAAGEDEGITRRRGTHVVW